LNTYHNPLSFLLLCIIIDLIKKYLNSLSFYKIFAHYFQQSMISFGFLMVPLILFLILFILILLTSCTWMILFYTQPNRARVKYKSFYQRKNTRQTNSENFFNDDNLIKSIHSKKFEKKKKNSIISSETMKANS
jgi:energy-coupling factor transporter transmembrane protein EcfT